MSDVGLLGGVFDPPHNGHVALARAAQERFSLDPLLVFVVAAPGHKGVRLDPEIRLRLARAAFPGLSVELDDHAFTVDMLRDGGWEDPVFVIGADQWRDFPTWKDPAGVLELARIAVANRAGIETSLAPRPERVLPFEIDSPAVSSTEIRHRVARGEPIDGLVPAPVAALIDELGLYRRET